MKFKLIAISIVFLIFAVSPCFADTAVTDGGVAVTISDDEADLSFSTSPNVQMAWNTTSTAYTIQSQNDQTTKDNGLEYGMVTDQSGYSQRAKVVDKGAPIGAAGTDAGSLSDGTWTYMGGS